MATKPGVALQAVHFEEGPFNVRRGEQFYLRYRLAVGAGDHTAMRLMVDSASSAEQATTTSSRR
ncbi:hypothetical protein [Streptomyces sp. NPDC059786]|uniref:hypothetical protein n=1 Tax=Streptomyces sp. NPDC059786 TaxID=3346946 RepID=UPI003655378D